LLEGIEVLAHGVNVALKCRQVLSRGIEVASQRRERPLRKNSRGRPHHHHGAAARCRKVL